MHLELNHTAWFEPKRCAGKENLGGRTGTIAGYQPKGRAVLTSIGRSPGNDGGSCWRASST